MAGGDAGRVGERPQGTRGAWVFKVDPPKVFAWEGALLNPPALVGGFLALPPTVGGFPWARQEMGHPQCIVRAGDQGHRLRAAPGLVSGPGWALRINSPLPEPAQALLGWRSQTAFIHLQKAGAPAGHPPRGACLLGAAVRLEGPGLGPGTQGAVTVDSARRGGY